MKMKFNFTFGSGASAARRVAGHGRRALFATVALCCAAAVGAPARAGEAPPASTPEQQAGTRRIAGTVVDATGAAIVGASVRLLSAAGERTTSSDAAGRFAFEAAPAGPASVVVAFEQFDPVTQPVDDARAELRVVLSAVALRERVTVRAWAPEEGRIASATKIDMPLRDVPQAVTVIGREVMADQTMHSMADVVRFVPGIGIAQGEGNRDTPIFRGNSSTSDFYVDGIRDDVQYFRDVYNVERVEALKGPNAMIFGRGGVGGVINRVTRQAEWSSAREVGLQAGSWSSRRVTGDFGQALNQTVAARVTGVFENSDSYRDGVGNERYGVNPTLALALAERTTLRVGYEFFHDDRTADRGIPSFEGGPVETGASTFFGDAGRSESTVDVHVVSALVEHRWGRFTLRDRLSYGDYDKFYQNVFPGAVDATGTLVSLSAYNNGMRRSNLFNQTDLVFGARTGPVAHTLLAGMELGRQETDNLRLTGFFSSQGPAVTTVQAPLSDPTTTLPLEFRLNATDADNHGVAKLAAFYAQDQLAFGERVRAILGLRYDSFQVDFTNNRTASDLASDDGEVSPRLALVYKPREPVSLYASYSVSFLPRAGEQLSSLSLTNQALDPEEFRNYELGAKWEAARGLSVSAAVYRLDRNNVAVPDPVNPAVSILVDAQRSEGLELGVSGQVTEAWSVIGGYAYQDGEITRSLSATAQAGARLAQLPEHSFSLWNKYDISPGWGVGLGLLHRSEVFTSTDNTVVLPSFTRVDAAVYWNASSRLRAQVNVENLFDTDYYAFAHNNNNITPGSPFGMRVALSTRF
jgi:catecholate siderophore receptor